ncbi:MAG: phospho-N-acetylmuramoyl-pentapeptide-transferase [Phycisphaerales bacterium]
MLYLFLQLTKQWLIDHGIYWVFSVLDQIQFRALASAALSFLAVILMGPRTIAWLARKKIGDTGQTDTELLRATSESKANTPTMGGILIVGAICASTLLLADLSERFVQLGLIVTVWLAGVGLVDDWLKLTAKQRGSGRQGLQEWEKLVFQLGIGIVVGYFLFSRPALPTTITPDAASTPHSMSHVLTLPLQKTYVRAERVPTPAEPQSQPTQPARIPSADQTPSLREPSWIPNPSLWYLPLWLFIPIAALMISGMSNAVNITDGMDGLASGISGVVALGIFVLALVAGDEDAAKYLLVPHLPGSGELAVIAGATAGAALGFLWWNCSPAHVFMGDTGALALGGIMGYCAVAIRQEFVVLLMSGVFVAEIASVVIQRYYYKMTGGKRVFRCAPFHHHLNRNVDGSLLWPEQQIVVRLWIVTIILVVLGLASLKVR